MRGIWHWLGEYRSDIYGGATLVGLGVAWAKISHRVSQALSHIRMQEVLIIKGKLDLALVTVDDARSKGSSAFARYALRQWQTAAAEGVAALRRSGQVASNADAQEAVNALNEGIAFVSDSLQLLSTGAAVLGATTQAMQGMLAADQQLLPVVAWLRDEPGVG